MVATVVIALALVALFVWTRYNRLVKMRNKVRTAMSDIDVELSLRHNLVPNLVEVARGYMTHERETLEAVTIARSAAIATSGGAELSSRAAAETMLSSAVGAFLVTAERYPELKASQNFLLFQEQLTTTENRIAFARQHYNETVRQFNTAVVEFPTNMVARLLNFSAEEMFMADAQDRASVQVRVAAKP